MTKTFPLFLILAMGLAACAVASTDEQVMDNEADDKPSISGSIWQR